MKITLSNFSYQLFGILLGILKGMGFEVHGEKLINSVRIDLVIEMQKLTYIIEIKLDSDSNDALEQIESKKYHE